MDADRRTRLVWWASLVALFTFGALWCLRTAGDGFQPLDSPIVFDGAWRILGGQVPFRDFLAGAGLTPVYLQALFFRLLGVSWHVYEAHAAVVNGLYALVVALLLRRCGSGRVAALLWGAGSAIVLYPPIGTPFLDQHAFFFVTVAAWLATVATSAGGRRAPLAAAGVLPALGLAFLSKQNVGTLGLLPVLATGLLAWKGSLKDRERWVRTLAAGLVGGLGAVLLALGYGAATGMELAAFRYNTFDLPSALARSRLPNVPARAWFEVPFTWMRPALGPVVVAWATVVALPWVPVRRTLRPVMGERAPRVAHVLVAGVWTFTGAFFVVLTNNNPENAYPWVFLTLGLVHAGRATLAPRGALAVAIALAAIGLRDAWTFDREVNRTRVVQDIRFDPDLARPSRLPELAGLRFQVYPRSRLRIEDVDDVVEFLRERPGGIYVFGECTLLYALTGRPSLNPYLWYHPGLTIPDPRSPEFRALEDRALTHADEVRWVITGEGPSPEVWPRLAARFLARAVRDERFGNLRVLELAPASVR